MSHGKLLLIGSCGTVQGRLGWAGEILRKINEEYEPLLSNAGWLASAPFRTIHYIVRFGASSTPEIYFSRISSKHQELPVASQMSMEELHEVFLNKEKLRSFLDKEVKRVLLAVKNKYNLSSIPELGL